MARHERLLPVTGWALLRRLDDLVTRLTLGMAVGEELSLRSLVERRASLAVRDLLAWHERLPAVTVPNEAPEMELVAAVVFAPSHSGPLAS